MRLSDDHFPVTLDDRRLRPGAGFDPACRMNQIIHAQLRFEGIAERSVGAEHQQVRHVSALKAVELEPPAMENDMQAVAGSPLGHHVTKDAPKQHWR